MKNQTIVTVREFIEIVAIYLYCVHIVVHRITWCDIQNHVVLQVLHCKSNELLI